MELDLNSRWFILLNFLRGGPGVGLTFCCFCGLFLKATCLTFDFCYFVLVFFFF